ncbi:MAG TPA: hypothetical protein O0X23_02235 [Methanocorpusculum sp.]|nr:hypothetical protein [Methanocorpusculum sp.]
MEGKFFAEALADKGYGHEWVSLKADGGLCIGGTKDVYPDEGIAEFAKRLRPHATVFVTELQNEGAGKCITVRGDAGEGADRKWPFSRLTFTHMNIRLI